MAHQEGHEDRNKPTTPAERERARQKINLDPLRGFLLGRRTAEGVKFRFQLHQQAYRRRRGIFRETQGLFITGLNKLSKS